MGMRKSKLKPDSKDEERSLGEPIDVDQLPRYSVAVIDANDSPTEAMSRIDKLAWREGWKSPDDFIFYAHSLELYVKRLRDTLELIARPKRPDGTYNRSREACEQLAREALGTRR